MEQAGLQWSARSPGYVTRKVVLRTPRSAATLARYGLSKSRATSDQLAARREDEMVGMGRYKRRLRRYRQGMRGSRRYRGSGLYTGSGGYWGDLAGKAWNASAGLRSKAGSFLRGGGAGAWGTAAGHLMNATGIGEYEVSNDIVNGGEGTGIPTFAPADAGSTVTISHKEYISDVYAPDVAGTFQNTPYSINPGLERTFPWLSQIAANYEEYTLKQCIFTFRSSITDFVASNGQVGTIIMATQYNPTDATFTSKQDAMEYDAAMSGKVSANMLHGVECDPAQLSGSVGKYMRSGPVQSNTDLKQYDWGNLNVCISNTPNVFANQALGELWVSYTVELRKPKFFVSRGLNILRDVFVGQSDANDGQLINEIIDSADTANGQQNRIGGRIVPAAPGRLWYTFPATFSGYIKIRITYALGGVGGGTSMKAVFTSESPLGVIPIADMWNPGVPIQNTPGSWVSQFNGVTLNDNQLAAQYRTGMSEAHYQIVTPTTAGATVDNTIAVVLTDQNGGILYRINGFQIDVEVYNTSFNYTPTGALMLDNPETSVLESWPL